jgi:hypothetical protein
MVGGNMKGFGFELTQNPWTKFKISLWLEISSGHVISDFMTLHRMTSYR